MSTFFTYNALSAKRATAPTTLYSGVAPDIFDTVIAKYMGTGDGKSMGKMAMSAPSGSPAMQANPGN